MGHHRLEDILAINMEPSWFTKKKLINTMSYLLLKISILMESSVI